MIITAIETWRKGKYLISLNDEPAFVLYSAEVKKYGLKEGEELGDAVWETILEETLIKRAKTRTLHLLDKMDRTEKQLREKLRENMYPEEAIDAAVEAAKRGNYLNDARYASQYAYEKSRQKSRKMIEMELISKGIDRRLVADALQELGDSDTGVIMKLIEKKCPDPSELDFQKEQKLIRFLLGKGFSMSDIRREISAWKEKTFDE